MDEVVRRAVAAQAAERGPLLPILRAVQAELGWIPEEAVPAVAAALNLSRADVHGVLSFYPDFRTAPPGRCVVRICRAEACQAVGCEALVEDAVTTLGVALGATADDGSLTLEEVFCLGNCALGPSAQVDGRTYGRVSAARLAALVEATR